MVISAAAALLKDTVNRIGDLVDDGQPNQASRAGRHGAIAGVCTESSWKSQWVGPEAVYNPVDTFVQKKLADHRLAPAPSEDPQVLARRAALDLTGLLPDPADDHRQVVGWLNENTPNTVSLYLA